MRNFTWEMNSIGKVLVFYTDEMLEMCNVPIRISCETNDLFSPIKKKSHFKLFPNFTIFRSTFPIFFFKPDSDYYKHFKKRICQIGPGVLK
jgi:hypothetical protein